MVNGIFSRLLDELVLQTNSYIIRIKHYREKNLIEAL